MLARAQIVLRREEPPRGAVDSEQWEIVAGDQFSDCNLALRAEAQRKSQAIAGHRAIEDLVLVANILIHAVGERVHAVVAAVVAAAPGEQHDAIGIFHRQQAQNQLIDQREDGGVRADPQRQR